MGTDTNHNPKNSAGAKKLSMTDIARLADVSIATVSRVLNGNGRFSPETQRRVLSVIEESGYRVNLSAKSLRTSRSFTLGVIIPDITNEFFAKIIRSIEISAAQADYTVFVCDSDESPQREQAHINSLISRGVDGIIFSSCNPNLEPLPEMPVVYIDRRPQNSGTLVISDNEQGGLLATRELINAGCKKILFLRDRNSHSTVNYRRKGYLDALKQSGIEYDPRLEIVVTVGYNEAKAAVIGALENGVDFDSVFATNDLMAIAAIHALRQRGLTVPQDVKVVGFDGISVSGISSPTLTTINQNTQAFGSMAVKLLLETIEKKAAVNTVHVIPVELVRRQSTEQNN